MTLPGSWICCSPVRRLSGSSGRFRDLVVHRYRRLQLAKVWEIVTEDVATLKHQLEPLVPRPN